MSLPQRKSPRLAGYDYAQEGAYFVTICVQGRLLLFGGIIDQVLTLTGAGEMVDHWWREIPNKFADVQLDHWIVMPNHFHGIVCLNRADEAGLTTSLIDVMRWFKAMTTNAYLRGVKADNWPPFDKRLWQRSYYDHIIRSQADLNRIREYVLNNPLRWREDTFYE